MGLPDAFDRLIRRASGHTRRTRAHTQALNDLRYLLSRSGLTTDQQAVILAFFVRGLEADGSLRTPEIVVRVAGLGTAVQADQVIDACAALERRHLLRCSGDSDGVARHHLNEDALNTYLEDSQAFGSH